MLDLRKVAELEATYCRSEATISLNALRTMVDIVSIGNLDDSSLKKSVAWKTLSDLGLIKEKTTTALNS